MRIPTSSNFQEIILQSNTTWTEIMGQQTEERKTFFVLIRVDSSKTQIKTQIFIMIPQSEEWKLLVGGFKTLYYICSYWWSCHAWAYQLHICSAFLVLEKNEYCWWLELKTIESLSTNARAQHRVGHSCLLHLSYTFSMLSKLTCWIFKVFYSGESHVM